MTTTTNLSAAQSRALASVGEWGGIDATPATFRILKDRGLVSVDQRTGRVTLTDRGHQALAARR